MAEAYHQWLNNLTVCEQIDRFFNPNKYSCSNMYPFGDWITVFWWLFFICVGLVAVYAWWLRFYKKEVGKIG